MFIHCISMGVVLVNAGIASVAEIAAHEPDESGAGKNHWFNHLLVNTDSTRLGFLHRPRWLRMTDTVPKRIALLVETSHGSGRDIVHGVAAYLRERGCDWVVDHETRRRPASARTSLNSPGMSPCTSR
jgi:hypothetical protein